MLKECKSYKLAEHVDCFLEVPFDDIKPYAKNYQNHEANKEHIKNSIKSFIYDKPIVVDKNNVIVKGHGAYIALKELEYDSIPFIHKNSFLDSSKKSSASRIADNESAKGAGIIYENLNYEIDLIDKEYSMVGYGLKDKFDLDTEQYKDLDEQLDGMEEYVTISISVPLSKKEVVIAFLANGEANTAHGLGLGILKKCESL